MNCDEQICIKGDLVGEANLRRHRDEAQFLLEMAEAAQADGDFGADRWVALQQVILERLDQLCKVFDGPTVPGGASKVKPASRIAQAQLHRLADVSDASAARLDIALLPSGGASNWPVPLERTHV